MNEQDKAAAKAKAWVNYKKLQAKTMKAYTAKHKAAEVFDKALMVSNKAWEEYEKAKTDFQKAKEKQ